MRTLSKEVEECINHTYDEDCYEVALATELFYCRSIFERIFADQRGPTTFNTAPQPQTNGTGGIPAMIYKVVIILSLYFIRFLMTSWFSNRLKYELLSSVNTFLTASSPYSSIIDASIFFPSSFLI